MTRLPENIPQLLRAAGLTVVEMPGWKDRLCTGSGNCTHDPDGNLHHHTGSTANGRAQVESMTFKGRPDLSPPLCQLSSDRQGVIYVCARGRANHAGVAKSTGPMPSGDGNKLYVGWEHQNSGFEPFPKAQYEAIVTASAVVDIACGWGASHNRAHKETSVTGKWDPTLDMDRLREDIAAEHLGRKPAKMSHVQKGNIILNTAIGGVRKSIEEYQQSPQKRVVVWGQITRLKVALAVLRSVRATMPKK